MDTEVILGDFFRYRNYDVLGNKSKTWFYQRIRRLRPLSFTTPQFQNVGGLTFLDYS